MSRIDRFSRHPSPIDYSVKWEGHHAETAYCELAPNLTFSADGKMMYVMAVDNKNGAPYEGKVYAVKLK